MSRFIKTKDGKVFDIHEYWSSKAFEIEPNEDYWVDEMLRKKGIDKKDCKVVSTIEELCDRFVYVTNKGNHYIKNSNKEVWLALGGEKPIAYYGAIWTDKGLIYRAKMNSKGELELL